MTVIDVLPARLTPANLLSIGVPALCQAPHVCAPNLNFSRMKPT